MVKNIYYILFIFVLFSCKEKDIEFIQSNARPNLYLIKNVPENDSLLKNIIIRHIYNNSIKSKKTSSIDYYKYTSDTKYFIDNDDDDDDRFAPNRLTYYNQDEIAFLIIAKCKNDTTKKVGRFHYYGLNNNEKKIDTIIYYCK